jgi:pimeloyl-ACP methyl ester carboxylesterase
MSDNWISIGKELSNHFEVYLIDARNHGNSPHADTMTYPEIAKDIFVFFNHHSIDEAIVMGHSMGGKTATFFAAQYPELVKKLIIVDISPFNFIKNPSDSIHSKMHRGFINALESLDLENLNTRTEILQILEKRIGSKPIAQFLMKNIIRDGDNFSWKLNLTAISNQLDEIFKGLENNNISNINLFENIPSLLIKGNDSNYLPDENVKLIKEKLPNAKFETIENAGHWVHAEQSIKFLEILKDYIL